MKLRHFQSELQIPAPPEAVFPFFSNPANLDAITPPWLRFQIVRQDPGEMKAGVLIDYRIRLRGIPISWRTRISVWDPPHKFVDEQLRGPYSRWIHTHEFIPSNGGTLMRDSVLYATPFDFLVHRWFVRPDVEKIFAYRSQALTGIFKPQGEVGRGGEI